MTAKFFTHHAAGLCINASSRKHRIRSFLSILVIAAICLCACNSEEISRCNDGAVLKILKGDDAAKLGEQRKSQALQRLFLIAPRTDPDAQAFAREIDRWSVSVLNIRQLSYDANNNTRFCAAEFAYSEFSFSNSAAGMWLPKAEDLSPCPRSFTYRIDPLIDKPNAIYVSWECP